ncbi:hypothetical protein, partial [Neisseria arctica]|uniref:hypothetical protein n=1 Tax=Neisseria arctica TaxID=1470200 RepID=UPI001F2754D2
MPQYARVPWPTAQCRLKSYQIFQTAFLSSFRQDHRAGIGHPQRQQQRAQSRCCPTRFGQDYGE